MSQLYRCLVLFCWILACSCTSRQIPQSTLHVRAYQELSELLKRASSLSSAEKDVVVELLLDRARSGFTLAEPNNGTGEVHDGIPEGVDCEAVTV